MPSPTHLVLNLPVIRRGQVGARATTWSGGHADVDGRSDAGTPVYDDATGTLTHYVVPGATPHGTYAIGAVAAVPLTTDPPYQLSGIGDIDAGALDDVTFPGDGVTKVWLGADLDLTLWVPEGGVRFTAEGSEPNVMHPCSYADIVDDGDATWLVLTTLSPGGDQMWAWDLGDLCAGSPLAPAGGA
jgi:hypothetical protein